MTNDDRGIFDDAVEFRAACHRCDWDSGWQSKPHSAKHERFKHVHEKHDPRIDWHKRSPALERRTEGEDL